MEENEKLPELTTEQKVKLKKLKRKSAFKGALINLKFVSLSLITSVCVYVLDLLYIHSNIFLFGGAILNGLFLGRLLRVDLNNQRAKNSRRRS